MHSIAAFFCYSFTFSFCIIKKTIVVAITASLLNETRSVYIHCSDDNDCRGYKQYCNTVINLCECQPFYEYSSVDTSHCNPCPEVGEECMSCCSNSNLVCYHGVCTRCSDEYYECE